MLLDKIEVFLIIEASRNAALDGFVRKVFVVEVVPLSFGNLHAVLVEYGVEIIARFVDYLFAIFVELLDFYLCLFDVEVMRVALCKELLYILLCCFAYDISEDKVDCDAIGGAHFGLMAQDEVALFLLFGVVVFDCDFLDFFFFHFR